MSVAEKIGAAAMVALCGVIVAVQFAWVFVLPTLGLLWLCGFIH